MFGDGGHALIVTMFASWMCLNEEKLSKIKEEVHYKTDSRYSFKNRILILILPTGV
jgi:vacuolar-type H+-ATPase subunit I/STV1